MMPPLILITDTNIWIDLDNGEILADVFRLPYRLMITDYAIRELTNPRWSVLEKYGLEAYESAPDLVLELGELRQAYKRLSITDLAAFLVARELQATLLTGDQRLYDLAKTKRVSVHGLLWLMDEMIRCEIITCPRAAKALEKMIACGARLPANECDIRLKKWRT